MKKLTREVIEAGFNYMIVSTGDVSGAIAMKKFTKYLEENGYLEEPLTFEKIRKECIAEESVFIDDDEYQYTFLGFYDGKLLVGRNERVYRNNESSIASWRIKK